MTGGKTKRSEIVKCPYCLNHIHAEESRVELGNEGDRGWFAVCVDCPACSRLICRLGYGQLVNDREGKRRLINFVDAGMFKPKSANRAMPGKEVPKDLAEDYNEACLVLPDSPKASAALSRRCLQHLLLEAAKVKPGDLVKQIQEVLDSDKLPSHIAESIDAVRNIGNFAAHPSKSQSTGDIVPVEPGEAEWNLDVLEALFDFYYVQPAVIKAKKNALNKKLIDAGRKPMK